MYINIPGPAAGLGASFEAIWPPNNPPAGAGAGASFFSSVLGGPNRLNGAAGAAVGAATIGM